MRARKLWIICPCFFDVSSFLETRKDALRSLASEVPRYDTVQFVLVDDSAGTDPAVRELSTPLGVRVVTPPYNLGHQGALVYALRSLGEEVDESDAVLTMDSDGEDRPTDVPAILHALQPAESSDELQRVALAWRTARRESLAFKLCYFFFKRIFRLLTGRVIRNGNFAAFRGWFLKEVIHHPHFDQCYASTFISLPLQITFVPLPRGQRFFGRSKMGFTGLFTHGLKMLMPFTEAIASRGVIVSGALTFSSVVLLAMVWKSSTALVFMASFSILLFALLTGVFVLLFATFSQSKALSLRRLHEMSVRKAS